MLTLEKYNELEAKCKTLEASMTDSATKFTAAIAEKNDLLTKVTDLEAKLAALSNTPETPELTALKAENAELKAKVSTLETASTELVELKASFDAKVKEQAEIKASEIIASAHVPAPVKVSTETDGNTITRSGRYKITSK